MKKSPFIIAAAQMKFRAAIADNLAWITETILDCGRAGVDAVLFPECAVTGYNLDFETVTPESIGSALRAVGHAAQAARCHVLMGSPWIERGKRFNSLVVFNRRGRRVFCYSKIHLTERDCLFFVPGNRLAFFYLDDIPCTAIICHERRYPELVRLPVMLGAQVVFHPNAGLDTLAVSKAKRGGRDGITVRAFENQVYYVFANSVGPQGDGFWSAGDSKIVAPDSRVLALANNRGQAVIQAELDLSCAGRRYARDALNWPAFLRPHWKRLLAACRRQLGLLALVASLAGSRAAEPPTTPALPTLRVPAWTGAIHIDGRLDEPCYQQPPLLSHFVVASHPEQRAPATKAWLFWQPERLSFAFECADGDIVAAPPSAHEHDVDNQDRIELFLWSGQPADPYLCLEIGALGATHDYLAHFYRRFDDAWSPVSWEYAVSRMPGGYRVEGAISQAALAPFGFRLQPGTRWRAGLFRADFSRAAKDKPTWITWVDAKLPKPDFHVAQSFGKIVLK